MKKRRTALFAFLLTAAVSMGIGFAALSDSFTINGELGANVNNNNLIVVFDGETAVTPEVSETQAFCSFATDAGAAAIDGKTTCELNFSGLSTKGDTAHAHLRVENRSTQFAGDELDATLSAPTVDYKSVDQSMFKITATWENEGNLKLEPMEKEGATNYSNVICVKVELLTTPTASVTSTGFTVSFQALTA